MRHLLVFITLATLSGCAALREKGVVTVEKPVEVAVPFAVECPVGLSIPAMSDFYLDDATLATLSDGQLFVAIRMNELLLRQRIDLLEAALRRCGANF